ncbi:EAL domain-containing protein [Vibrio natriegens]|uniref:GGDEF/EAL domain-containing response regulator n=1 Tax=Vibrio natriegens TaxID=691 RepID=UPI0021E7179E|nr:EAL domain-containing response regulator [Vibrio natriegens]UYI50042.1 EAL domain-containing protein [Vibrio natriegens]
MCNSKLKVVPKFTAALNINQREPSIAGLKQARIMMVDDEPLMLDIIEALLEEQGYHDFVAVAQSTQALSALQQKQPDILLLDLIMPKTDGFEILKKLRNIPNFKYLPVIILTSSNDTSSKVKALELGATDFLSKPVDASELALRIRNTLAAKAYQDQLAYYDNLTGLPNRTLFLDRLEWELQKAQRQQQPLAVLEISLDRFNQIKDTLGPKVGEQILKEVSLRLKEIIRSSDVITRTQEDEPWRNIARFDSDEFALLLHGMNITDNVASIANRILEALKAPFFLDNNEIFMTAVIGIAVYPEDGNETEKLLKHACAAKDCAKQKGLDNYQFYCEEINARSKERLSLETKLRHALENQELELYYQPKVDVKSGRILGAECLLRWFHPIDGLISPEKFIPLAEDTGLIVPIGEWVLHEACKHNQEWVASGYDNLNISINVSSKQFADKRLKSIIISALKSSGLNARYLTLEMTESTMMGDAESNICLLHRLKELGISFSIDDFGTGYSSLNYLKKFPIQELKIDRSFIIDVTQSDEDASIVKAILAMSHNLGLKVVAEGVENLQQLKLLQSWDCDIIQGYYFSRPLSQTEFTNYLR